jgi:hypothetical protein
MNIPHFLEAYEQSLRSKSACFPGSHVVFRGLDLHDDPLFATLDWFGLHVFAVTGIKLSPAQQKLISFIWTITSYPDARLWNNRIAALAGTTRSTACLGVAAGIAGTEAINFGLQPMIHAADFLVRAEAALRDGQALDDIVTNEVQQFKHLGGYGRPVATLQADERVMVLKAYIDDMKARNELVSARYFELAFDIEKMLQQMGKKLTMNYGSVVLAPLLDLGLTPQECYMVSIVFLTAGMTPSYREALERPAGATFPIRCDHIRMDKASQNSARIW